MSSILLRGGILLLPDAEADDRVVASRADLLIVDGRIASIEPNIDFAAAVQVDCSAKIVSPGFIDTHHHLWQTQLKGRHGDGTLLDYMASGNLTASLFTPADVYWGQLGGALEALDSGTTTVVDLETDIVAIDCAEARNPAWLPSLCTVPHHGSRIWVKTI